MTSATREILGRGRKAGESDTREGIIRSDGLDFPLFSLGFVSCVQNVKKKRT